MKTLIGWALPDQLVFSTVSALLHLASRDSSLKKRCFTSVISFTQTLVSHLQNAPGKPDAVRSDGNMIYFKSSLLASIILSEHLPSFHGLYRALTSTPFAWSPTEWSSISSVTSELFAESSVNRLNDLTSEFAAEATNEEAKEFANTASFIRTIMHRYASLNRPLSGYFVVCEVMEIQWTVLGQIVFPPLCPDSPASSSSGAHRHSRSTEAEAANMVWQALMSSPFAKETVIGRFDSNTLGATRKALDAASKCFLDLLEQVQEFADIDPELYAFETLSESLVGGKYCYVMGFSDLLIPQKLATVCALVLDEIDPTLYDRVKLVLSDKSPVVDAFLQDAALKSSIVLVQK